MINAMGERREGLEQIKEEEWGRFGKAKSRQPRDFSPSPASEPQPRALDGAVNGETRSAVKPGMRGNGNCT